MQPTRILLAGLVASVLAVTASAQFDGPAPLAWRFVQPTSVAPGGSPVVHGDVIYQSIGGRVFALEKNTGNLIWRFPQLDPIPGSFRSSPLVIDDPDTHMAKLLVVAGDNKLLYGVDPKNGNLVWSSPTASAVLGQPVATDSAIVFATSDNQINAIGFADGKSVWSRPFKVFDGISGSISAYGNSVLYFNLRNQMANLDMTTEKMTWGRALQLAQLPPNASATVMSDNCYITSGSYLINVNPVNGLARWQINTGILPAFPPSASADAIYVSSQDGKIMGYAPDQTKLFNTPMVLTSVPNNAPVASGKDLIVTTDSGIVMIDPDKTTEVKPATGSDPAVTTKGAITWDYIIHPLAGTKEDQGKTQSSGPGTGAPGLGNRGKQEDKSKVIVIPPCAPVTVSGSTLLVAAADGSLLAFDKNSGVDLTAPDVKMLFPNPGDMVSGQPPLALAFRLTDDASGINVNSIKVVIDGTEYEHTFTKDGLLIVRFTVTGANKALDDGRKTIIVSVADWLGNQAEEKFALTIDNTLKPVTLPGSEDKNQQGGAGFGKGGGPGGGPGGGDQ